MPPEVEINQTDLVAHVSSPEGGQARPQVAYMAPAIQLPSSQGERARLRTRPGDHHQLSEHMQALPTTNPDHARVVLRTTSSVSDDQIKAVISAYKLSKSSSNDLKGLGALNEQQVRTSINGVESAASFRGKGFTAATLLIPPVTGNDFGMGVPCVTQATGHGLPFAISVTGHGFAYSGAPLKTPVKTESFDWQIKSEPAEYAGDNTTFTDGVPFAPLATSHGFAYSGASLYHPVKTEFPGWQAKIEPAEYAGDNESFTHAADLATSADDIFKASDAPHNLPSNTGHFTWGSLKVPVSAMSSCGYSSTVPLGNPSTFFDFSYDAIYTHRSSDYRHRSEEPSMDIAGMSYGAPSVAPGNMLHVAPYIHHQTPFAPPLPTLMRQSIQEGNGQYGMLVSKPLATMPDVPEGLAPQTNSKLMGLPGELRNRIYRYAITEESTIVIDRHTWASHQPALLKTCKQVRYEALPIFYAENEISTCIRDWNPVVRDRLNQVLMSHKIRTPNPHHNFRGRPNWDNLKAWLKAAFEGETTGISSCVGKNRTLERKTIGVMFLLVDLAKKESDWAAVLRLLEAQRGLLGMNDTRWLVSPSSESE
jgi:hypothetical protein